MSILTKVATVPDIPPGKALAVSVGKRRIALFNVRGTLYAIDDECTHAGGSLAEGTLDGPIVSCPWHGANFDVTTGTVLTEPAYANVASYKVVVEGLDIKIETPE